MTRYITVDEVLVYHRVLMIQSGEQAVLVSSEKLDAAISRPQATAFGQDAYPTLADKAAALLQAIVIGHPFVDGNKRAGAAAMLAFLELNGVTMPDYSDELYELIVSVAGGTLREVADIAAGLHKVFVGI